VTAERLPVEIPIFPCLRDHRFAGRAVLPAVEAMQILAATIPADQKDLHPTHIRDARFDKFLILPTDADSIPAFHDISVDSEGETISKLITRTTSAKGFSRIKEHVTVRWGRVGRESQRPEQTGGEVESAGNRVYGVGTKTESGFGTGSGLPRKAGARSEIPNSTGNRPIPEPRTTEPPEMFIPSDRLYAEMVPFAPAFHNLMDGVQLWPEGASAEVSAPDHSTFPGPLGSPFPLDAAFHAACAWSQRYAGIVAFPVGLAVRDVKEPTWPGETYRATVQPVQSDSATLVFDIYLADETGRLRESALGVEMRDVSGGKLAPPGWVVR
jgi:hypothetical protein